jgi:transcriptional repressor NrdR
MNCPYCGYNDSRVVDSREVDDGIRRRRQCLSCDARFTTYERVQSASLFVIKKDQRREVFDKNKLLVGIRKACEKRPLPADTVERLADEIETELYRQYRAEIPSAVIGDMVMERLKKLDFIAYVRFASVYRQFTDISTLKQVVDALVSDEIQAPLPTAQLPLIPAEELTRVARVSGRRK